MTLALITQILILLTVLVLGGTAIWQAKVGQSPVMTLVIMAVVVAVQF